MEDTKIVRKSRRVATDCRLEFLGEDEIARGEKELDVLTRQHVELIDDALKRKEAELLEV